MKQPLKQRTSLVTGASSGLGVDFAKQLAAEGSDLILVARREDRLKEVKQSIETTYGVRVTLIAMDLSTPDAPQALYDQIKQAGETVDVLVNNAGFGYFGDFIDLDWQKERQMLELDIVTLVHLTKLFAKDMRERDFGYIMQIASTGAYQPSPLYASYAAAKAFVLSYGEAINYELKGTNVSCTVVSPGVTATEFLRVSGQEKTFYHNMTMMTSEQVARIGVRKMLRRRSSIVTGLVNAIMAASTRLMPRPLAAAVGYFAMKNH